MIVDLHNRIRSNIARGITSGMGDEPGVTLDDIFEDYQPRASRMREMVIFRIKLYYLNYALYNDSCHFQILPSTSLILDLMESLNLFFRRACYYQNSSYRKMNEIKVVDKLPICEVGFVHFWHKIRPKKLRFLQEMVQSFHEVQS